MAFISVSEDLTGTLALGTAMERLRGFNKQTQNICFFFCSRAINRKFKDIFNYSLQNRPLSPVLISGMQVENNLKYLKRGATKTGPPVTFLPPLSGRRYVEL